MPLDSAISRIRIGESSDLGLASARIARQAYSALAEIFISPLSPGSTGLRDQSWLLSREWSPHSVLAWPAHRPARSSCPASTGRVQGQQPIEGYPRSWSGLYGTSLVTTKAQTSRLVHFRSGLTFTRPNLASQPTTSALARCADWSARMAEIQAS